MIQTIKSSLVETTNTLNIWSSLPALVVDVVVRCRCCRAFAAVAKTGDGTGGT
jgi:hypothetical protein